VNEPHLGDQLELYALGDLSPEERRAVEAHVADCADCAALLGEAEQTLSELAELLPRYVAPRKKRRFSRTQVWLGAAAAVIVAAVLAGVGGAGFEQQLLGTSDDVRAQSAMARAHFNHASLTPVGSGIPASKVVYARDFAWLYAIVDDGSGTYRLSGSGGGAERDLGAFHGNGLTATLFVEHPGTLKEVELTRDGQVVARAKL
jgi:hypothetical protein